MRYLLLVIFLMAAVQLPAIEPEQLTELIAIFQEYKEATTQLEQGLTELQAGLDISRVALQNSIVQTQNLKLSFKIYRTDTDETIRKLRIGIFAIGAACILTLITAIIT